ncbi:MAG: hypothetical protein IE927_10485 [Rhodobacterales bacterium]|nr:hypothetical protein [Rhodobacterales bacterium]
MTRAPGLARLSALSRLIADVRLSRLAEAQARRTRTEAQMRALDAGLSLPEGADAVDGANALRHLAWVDACKADLNLTLARQRAEVEATRAAAARDLARAEAVAALTRRAAAAHRPRPTDD